MLRPPPSVPPSSPTALDFTHSWGAGQSPFAALGTQAV